MGVGNDGDIDWALALTIYFLSFFHECLSHTLTWTSTVESRQSLLESSENVFVKLAPGPFLALLFSHLNPRGVVLRTRPSYFPRGTCPRWADTPAAPGRAESLSRQFLALVKI
jgi:hypothetical protein